MNHRDEILNFVTRYPGKDDDEIAAALGITPRQTVNQICRTLMGQGVIERYPGSRGKIINYPVTAEEIPIVSAPSRPLPSGDATAEWFWEGNVTELIAEAFVRREWEILAKADTRSKERGIDLHLRLGTRELMIEVKGYPSITYRDSRRVTERKPTSPNLQAGHWYAHALLKGVRLISSDSTVEVALAFPDFPRYRSLHQQTRPALQRLNIAMIFVAEDGTIDTHGL